MMLRKRLCDHADFGKFRDSLFRALAVEKQRTIRAILRALSLLEMCVDVDGLFPAVGEIASRKDAECREFQLTVNEAEESVFRSPEDCLLSVVRDTRPLLEEYFLSLQKGRPIIGKVIGDATGEGTKFITDLFIFRLR